MENVYTLSGRFAEMDQRAEALQAELEDMFEENGGEVTEVTEEMQQRIDALDALKKEIVDEIIANADDYAAIAKNKEAQQKMFEAELKTLKEEQAKACARIQSKINHCAKSAAFWKDNFAAAMNIDGTQKIGGAKTDHKFSIYFLTSKSLDVDEDVVLAPYQEALDDLKAQLPTWVSVKAAVSKTELKKEQQLPEGAALVESRSLQIR